MVVLDSNIELYPRRWQIIQAFLVSDATLRLDQAPSGKLVWARRTSGASQTSSEVCLGMGQRRVGV